MCVNYEIPSGDSIARMFQVDAGQIAGHPAEVWQDYAAPFVRRADDGGSQLTVGTYGMIPKWKQHGPRLSTMNARAETIAEKRSYSGAWRRTQTCLLPMTCFYEPNYESGKAERWAIGMTSGEPFCVAGLWRMWEEAKGFSFSFTQITINADEHPLMRRFHKPGDEKRSLVIIPKNEWNNWLTVPSPEHARSFLTGFPVETLYATCAPREPRKSGQPALF